jgi:hypothetical protein
MYKRVQAIYPPAYLIVEGCGLDELLPVVLRS